ncbi:metal-dependent transcriptional regulator [Periweissella fabalis]|uniref:Metal-dependent transcriptional regulator n=1 Tax=Periweissella fabalis TaxID=1070421 RepID=A0A7X6N309_9LACO|nr:metal-dependent transcriptional regulator [Periweissella fabalis]MCM0599661.1 metal-dependent transcriptional regulator [Periweissella fabalis]NKZ24926.1 metal-dependent transcriptional regulator [Periweissella fabalis]
MADSVSKTIYLQTILELTYGQSREQVANNQIAEHLHVTPSSVSNMMAKLQESGEVDVEPYYGVTLTPKGKHAALRLTRIHRLMEVFFSEKLNLSPTNAYTNAVHFDHNADDELLTALDAFLNHPKTCPHGLPIPTANYEYEITAHRNLSDLPEGTKFTILGFNEDAELLEYLQLMGITIASTWTFTGRMPFSGPLVIENSDSKEQLQISEHAAHYIYTN